MLSINHPYIYSPKEEVSYMTEHQRRYPVPTPPPSSASPIELAPILDMCDSTDNRPLSPDSPKLKKFPLSSDGHFGPHLAHLAHPPPFLEPMPVLQSPQSQTGFFSLELFKVFKNKSTIPKLQIPIPRRSRPVNTHFKPTLKDSIPSLSSSSSSTSSTSSSSLTYDDHDMISTPMSPIMAAASASAAAAAAHRHPGSQVAKSLLKSIQPSTVNSGLKRSFGMLEDDDTFSTSSSDDHDFHPSYKKSNVDQSMFLTKNAHIKRPRNAWIHFRCHYGQALKSQDPTLRAEEISKRASRRWSKLTESEKKPWHGLAEQEKLAHREAFPEYRYCPRRANSSSSPPSTPVPHATVNNNHGRPRSVSDSQTPLHMHDVFHRNNQKRMKRCSK
ncbi:Repressor of filamentous growth 1 [Choanephora cucurbitarum]|uniref:Repressor of filamentous growth 1 n=1 Tax=Choanephora cucurbitarum TaxID=101091 RepID=A0A1C7NMW2_9FUNG|nr:Repressor of filamentous growth 1 [Choanephora cucurbitarum]